MGADTVLLVNRRAALGLIAGAFVPPGSAQAEPVVAADYEQFWLWAGVTSQPVLARARSLAAQETGLIRRCREPFFSWVTTGWHEAHGDFTRCGV